MILKKSWTEETLIFSTRYKDLSYNAVIILTLYSPYINPNHNPLGRTSISLYDNSLRLREGEFNLLIYPSTSSPSELTLLNGLAFDEDI